MTLLEDLNEIPVEGKEEADCFEGPQGRFEEKKGTKRGHGGSWRKQVSLLKKQKYIDWMPKGLLGASIRPKGEKTGQETPTIPDLNLPACGEESGAAGPTDGPKPKLGNKRALRCGNCCGLRMRSVMRTPWQRLQKQRKWWPPQEGHKKIPLGFWFKNWTIKHNLSEFPFNGANYTWTNNQEGEKLIQERLDIAYGNTEWKNSHTNVIEWNFPIFLSDHGPIALDTSPSTVERKRPYRLKAWSYNKTEIKEITEKSESSGVRGSKMFIL
ncbi:hypothetical protein RDABS01_013671 [Bienertia sinuspersici]